MTGRDPGAGGAATRQDEAAAVRARLSGRPVAAIALLPLRVFLGITYLYAGIDKFTSLQFLTDTGPYSVAGQMEAYLRASPLAPLVEAALPAAVPIGVLIALAEIAIGIGLLTGLAYRVAAWSGFGLSVLFWLTASWSIAPYYFSPDLPYAFGFLTLALAGHGHLLVIDPWPSKGGRHKDGQPDDWTAPDPWPSKEGRHDDGQPDDGTVPDTTAPDGTAPDGQPDDGTSADTRPARAPDSASTTRRALLQTGIVAALTIFTAGAVSRLRALGASGAATAGGAAATPSPTAVRTPAPTPAQTPAATAPATPGTSPGTPGTSPGPTAQPGTGASATATPLATVAPTAAATAAATAGTAPTGPVIASVTDLAPNSGMPFTVPNEVPFAQNPGGPGVLVALPDGRFVAYSARCTHGQCTVAYDPSVSELVCPCHLGRFDPANAAAVLGGPPPLPLAEIPVAVDGSGQVHVVLEG